MTADASYQFDARAWSHLTAKYVSGWSPEESERYANLLSRAFDLSGDPRNWLHFSELSEETQGILSRAFNGWTELRLLEDAIAAPIVSANNAAIQ